MRGTGRARRALARVASAGVAAVLAAGMMVASPFTTVAYAAQGDAVTVDKVATRLDDDDQTDVTLSIGSTQSKENVAVLFVLDKSTSQGMRDEAAEMLDELASKTNTNILYDVVIFSGTATATGWRNAQDDAGLEDTKKNFANGETTSGTNMDAGIELAQKEMNSLSAGYETYLVTLSDGITYVWSEDGSVKCVPIQGLGNGGVVETSPQNGADTWAMMYGYGTSLADVYGNFNGFLSAAPAKMAATVEGEYVQDCYGESSLDNPISTYIYDDEKNDQVTAQYACGTDFAVYQAATGYASLVGRFDHSYAFAVPEAASDGFDNTSNWENYPWGRELMEYCNSLSTNAGYASVSNADAQKIFSGIADEILYEIESGVVTDVIDADFDLTDVSSLELSVGGRAVPKQVSGNVVTFDDGAYVVTYAKADDGTETLVWEINVPVEQAAGVELSYALALVNKSTVPGDHQADTNEWAKLDYVRHDGSEGEKYFPVPTVTYTVPEPVTPEPEDPKPEEPRPETPKPEDSTPRPATQNKVASTEKVPETGDAASLVPVVGLLAAGAGAGALGLVLRRRSR